MALDTSCTKLMRLMYTEGFECDSSVNFQTSYFSNLRTWCGLMLVAFAHLYRFPNFLFRQVQFELWIALRPHFLDHAELEYQTPCPGRLNKRCGLRCALLIMLSSA
jgi:hypothetical protein